MSAGNVKGWCPGAYRPMMSGDGLVVRIRPYAGEFSKSQLAHICALATHYGNGILEVTNRANLQMRGISEEGHDDLLSELMNAGLLDRTPELETRRNILVDPFRTKGDGTEELVQELTARLDELPALPAKFGFVIDTGAAPVLSGDPGDIRLERDGDGDLLLRLDGLATGKKVSVQSAISEMIAAAHWFSDHRGNDVRRMSALWDTLPSPAAWMGCEPTPKASKPTSGPRAGGVLGGVPFGQIEASTLSNALLRLSSQSIRLTPWRMLMFQGDDLQLPAPFITAAQDPMMQVQACPGAPYCSSATVSTRDVARALASRVDGDLHVSGCTKGCASKNPAVVTLVGRNGKFDLVRHGCSWDGPVQTGLDPEQLVEVIG